MGENSRIVVPIDFSPYSRAAAVRAFGFAEQFEADVHLLHAITFPPPTLDPGVPAALRDELRDSAHAEFGKFCSSLREAGYRFTESIEERDPAEAIHSAARDGTTRLIVMGSHGRRGLDRLILGSVAERTLHGAPVPVYVARETEAEAARPIRSVLLATDFSEDAEYVERYVAQWAGPLGAEVELFHAIRETAVLFAPYAVAGSSDFEGEMMEAAKRRIDRGVSRLEGAGVSVKTKIVYGPPSESIVERAESTGAQLIAMGTRGYSAFRRYLLGSVAQRVLRHAPCSVLVAGTPDTAGQP